MIKSVLFACAAFVAAASMTSFALAQDAGLYDDVIDPSKAYVRVFVTDATQASVAGGPVSTEDAQVSGYVSVPAGTVQIGSGGSAAEMSVEAGTYYTFAQTADGFVQFEDPAISDPSKAEVLFYNLTDRQGIDLFVPAAKTNAISGVAAGASQSVELRAPLMLAFEAQHEGAALATATDVVLERKQAVSLFLTQTADGVELLQVVNSFAEAN